MIDLNEVEPITDATAEARSLSVADVADRLNDHIEDLARSLLGEPNRTLSTRTQLRFGRKGSIAVEIGGEKQGRWFDHEHGVGGDGLTLICRELNLANGTACTWAMDWLGIDSGSAAPSTLRMPRQATEASPAATCDDEDAARVVKVAAIVNESTDLSGTPGASYLRNRGITAAPLPPSFRYRPDAHGRYGALVALATDANGCVNAVQQIYVTENGRKAPLKVQKRTNKARDDWPDTSAVRLPGGPPIILCEGVENALSVWQATGRNLGLPRHRQHRPRPGAGRNGSDRRRRW